MKKMVEEETLEDKKDKEVEKAEEETGVLLKLF